MSSLFLQYPLLQVAKVFFPKVAAWAYTFPSSTTGKSVDSPPLYLSFWWPIAGQRIPVLLFWPLVSSRGGIQEGGGASSSSWSSELQSSSWWSIWMYSTEFRCRFLMSHWGGEVRISLCTCAMARFDVRHLGLIQDSTPTIVAHWSLGAHVQRLS